MNDRLRVTSEAGTFDLKVIPVNPDIEGGDMPDEFEGAEILEAVKTGRVFSVGWLYLWRYVQALVLGGNLVWAVAMLLTADPSKLAWVVSLVFGAVLLAVCALLFHFERKAGTEQ